MTKNIENLIAQKMCQNKTLLWLKDKTMFKINPGV